MNNNNEGKNKRFNAYDYLVIVGVIIMILVVVSVGSYAYVTWRGEDTSGGLTTTIGDLATITFDKGVSLSSDSLSPVLSYEDGIYSTFSINKKIDEDVKMKIYLTVNSIDEELKSNSLKYILFASSDNNNFDNIASGSFEEIIDSRIGIIDDYKLSTQFSYYRLYIYLDGRMNNNNMVGKSLDVILNIGAEEILVEDDILVEDEVLNDDTIIDNEVIDDSDEVIDENFNDIVDDEVVENSDITS